MSQGSIECMEISGTITCFGSNKSFDTGGLCSYLLGDNSKIDKVINHCVVSGPGNVGGIVGDAEFGRICNCLNDSEIKGVYAGGIVGKRISYNSNLAILNCLNTANITGSVTGGILGHYDNSGYYSVSISNSVSSSQSVSHSGGISGTGSTYTSQKNYWLFDAGRNIGIEIGHSGGSKYAISSSNTCITMPEGKDVVELLNQWVETNGSGTYYKWKYEMIDGLPCPVFDRLK